MSKNTPATCADSSSCHQNSAWLAPRALVGCVKLLGIGGNLANLPAGSFASPHASGALPNRPMQAVFDTSSGMITVCSCTERPARPVE